MTRPQYLKSTKLESAELVATFWKKEVTGAEFSANFKP